MKDHARRKLDNLLLSTTLDEIHGKEELRYLATLIADHDHFREVLMTESNRYARRAKFEVMRGYLKFSAEPLDWYEMKERLRARNVAVQPFETDKLATEAKQYPESRLEWTQ